MSAAAVRLRGGVDSSLLGWTGLALAGASLFITLPPFLVRTPGLSVLLAGAACLAGGAAWLQGLKRLGGLACLAALLAAILAVLATRGTVASLEAVFVWSALLAATLRFATPLLLAAVGGIISERAGVIALGLEGMMLMGAFFAILAADLTGSWAIGVAVGMFAGGLLALLHGFFSIQLGADQVMSAIALNLLALGLTGYVFIAHYGAEGTPGAVPRVPDISLPLVEELPLVGEALGNASLLTWIALGLVPIVAVYLFRTRSGLRLRSAGEEPRAVDSVGVSVGAIRYRAVLWSGLLAGLGGTYLSLAFTGAFTQNMTDGRGFIAIAAVIFGGWRPLGTLFAALLFGLSSALAQRLPEFSESTAVLFQALPYVLTVVAVVGMIARSRAPAALGVPYRRG